MLDVFATLTKTEFLNYYHKYIIENPTIIEVQVFGKEKSINTPSSTKHVRYVDNIETFSSTFDKEELLYYPSSRGQEYSGNLIYMYVKIF
jgi:hypothetical protein